VTTRLGAPRVDEANECIWWGDRRVDLAPKAFLVLVRLLQQRDRIVTKAQLLDAGWPNTHVSDGVLTLAINQLREALGDDARQPRFIETVHRRGYRWIGEPDHNRPGSDLQGSASAPGVPSIDHRETEHRGSAAGPSCVGRDAALGQLQHALANAAKGTRQLVFVTGEPGIGKTTLIEEFSRRACATSVAFARGQCVDGYGASEAFLPLSEALEGLSRESEGDGVVRLLHRVAPAWLLQLPRLVDAQALAELRRDLAGSNGERVMREFLDFVEEYTADRTLVIVLEDLHWSDHASLGALGALAARRGPARLLVVMSYRPAEAVAQFHPVTRLKHELKTRGQCIEIALSGLMRDDIASYLAGRFPEHRLSQELMDGLHRNTGGNPLFLRNALADFEQRGWLVERDGAWECTVDVATLVAAVPESTRAMIAFRFEGLEEMDLHLLEAASVAGPGFATPTLAAMLERHSADVEVACARLARAQEFLAEGHAAVWPDGRAVVQHSFRHALYQQVLYGRVSPARRQLLHRRAAECLEKGFGDDASTIAAQLALHFARGAEPQRAAEHHQVAARQALDRYAYDHAIDHLRAAIADLSGTPADADRDGRELLIYATMLQPMFARLSTHSGELLHVVEQIRAISARRETTPELLVSLAMLTGHFSMSGDMRSARATGEEMLARAEAVPWGEMMATVARGVLGYCQARQGELEVGVENLAASMNLPDMTSMLPIDPGITTTVEASVGCVLMGQVGRGLELWNDAMSRAEISRHPPTLVHAAMGAVRIGAILRDDELLERGAARIAALPEQMHEQWGPWVEIARSFTGSSRARSDSADRILRAGESLAAAGTPFYGLLYVLMATTALAACGRYDEADAQCTNALTLVRESGEAWCEPELLKLRSEIVGATSG
jgi:DNA-binding winged helix-turn-helix (wHTH) protein